MTDWPASGAKRYRAAVQAADLLRISTLFGDSGRPGQRLGRRKISSIADLIVADGVIGGIASALLGPAVRPVRALLLDKSDEVNWRLGWHQDRVIVVKGRLAVPGFGPWTIKDGQLHVQPLESVLRKLLTIRVHVDAVDTLDAPLQVLPGSPDLGRMTELQIDVLAKAHEPMTCIADAGDIWAYSTLIVHSSAEKMHPGHRRVLQLDYSAENLPGGLEWAALG